MKEKNAKILKWILQILVSALTGAGTAFGVSSCTVNSGNRETYERASQSSPMSGNNLQNNQNSNNRIDTVKIIKESNTIYTQE